MYSMGHYRLLIYHNVNQLNYTLILVRQGELCECDEDSVTPVYLQCISIYWATVAVRNVLKNYWSVTYCSSFSANGISAVGSGDFSSICWKIERLKRIINKTPAVIAESAILNTGLKKINSSPPQNGNHCG